MSEISDEIRKITKRYRDWLIKPCKELDDLADRIDREMIELPKGADGKPIHCGEELWVDCADYYEKRFLPSMRLENGGRWTLLFEGDPSIVTHERPDSLERIADEMDEMVDAADSADDTCEQLADLADRIRRLADKEG